jgi:hypothetical protein
VVAEVFDVGVAPEKPEELVNDRFEVKLFGGEEGKAVAEGIAGLGAEDRVGTSAGAVVLEFAVVENEAEKLVVLFHAVERIQARAISGGGDVGVRQL